MTGDVFLLPMSELIPLSVYSLCLFTPSVCLIPLSVYSLCSLPVSENFLPSDTTELFPPLLLAPRYSLKRRLFHWFLFQG